MLHKSFQVCPLAVFLPALLLSSGCHDAKFSTTVLNPLNLKLPFLPYQEPIRIGIVHKRGGIFDPASWNLENIGKLENAGSPCLPLCNRLQRYLNAPVEIDDLKPFQVAAHLQSGRLDFAILSASNYLKLSKEFGDVGQVIAISEVKTRQGIIVADARSDIHSLEDIRGHRFAFGPKGDVVLDEGAKRALEAAGIDLADIEKELLPVPNSYQYHISSREAAFEIAYGLGTPVGVIERSEYEAYPDSGGSFLLRTFGKDNFRILAETEPVCIKTIPEGPFLASPEADPKLVKRVVDFLMSTSGDTRRAFTAMGLAGFHKPSANIDKEMERLAANDPTASKSQE